MPPVQTKHGLNQHDLRSHPAIRPDSPPTGRKNRFNSFDFAALPQNQTKKKGSSLLPQAKKPLMRPASAPTA
jgi:hypothetical protein